MANFTLRGLSLSDVRKLHTEEGLASLTLQDLRGFSRILKAPPLFNTTTESPAEDVFLRVGSRGQRSLYVTSNCSAFRFAYYGENIPNTCAWCRREISDRSKVIGIPLADYSVTLEGQKTVLYDRPCCSFSCMYALFKKEEDPHSYRYSRLRSMIISLFRECHPGKKLKAAPNWPLHVRNGGSLSDEQFYSGSFSYRKTDTLVVPAKRLYLVERL